MLWRAILKHHKKSHKFTVWLLLILVIWTLLSTALATDFETYQAPAPVSLGTLDSRIKDLQASTSRGEQSLSKLLELYRKTIRYLEEVRTNDVASDAFIRSQKSDAEQATRISERLDRLQQKRSAMTFGYHRADTFLGDGGLSFH